LTLGREKQSGDNDRQKSKDNEVVPLKRFPMTAAATCIGFGVERLMGICDPLTASVAVLS
jgi:hypothetical protein